MKKTILFIISVLFLFAVTTVSAQTTNLVYNGDFEIYSALPTQMTQVDLAVGWNNVNNNNLNGGCGSPDYSYVGSFMFPCAISPFSGNGQMDIGIDLDTNYSEEREYISSHLNLPMVTGQQYSVSFYLTNGHLTDSTYGCSTSISNNFGIHFSMDTLTQVCFEVINVNPQLEITSIINSCDNWTHFVFKYIADSSYNYITLGNFRSNANTLYTYPPIYDNNIPYFACTFFFIDKIEIYPKLKIAGDSVICKGTPTTLKIIAGEPIVNWADSLSPNIIIATDSIITVTPNVTTTYVAYNNMDTAYYTVYVNNSPQVNLGNDTSLCAGQTLLLNATNANSTYLWQDNTTDSIYNVSQQGLYWVKVTNEYNCTVYDTINVNYNPTFNIVVNKSICQNQTYQVGTHIYATSGTFIDTLTTNTGCDSIITTNLIVNPFQQTTLNPIICQGEIYNVGTHTYTSNGIYIDSLTTYLGCDSIITTNLLVNPVQQTTLNPVICQGETYNENTHTYTTTGIYKDTLTTYLGCDSIVTINLTTVPLPTVNLGNDTTLCFGKIIILNATNASSTYFWQDSSTASTYNVSQEGTYWVTVTDNNNCIASDTIYINYQECVIPDIYIPNSFTPNGDGLNDIFNIKTTYEFSKFNIYICDRWGEVLFESTEVNFKWNGIYKGKLVPKGVYVYLITGTVKGAGDYIKKTGIVTVVR